MLMEVSTGVGEGPGLAGAGRAWDPFFCWCRVHGAGAWQCVELSGVAECTSCFVGVACGGPHS